MSILPAQNNHIPWDDDDYSRGCVSTLFDATRYTRGLNKRTRQWHFPTSPAPPAARQIHTGQCSSASNCGTPQRLKTLRPFGTKHWADGPAEAAHPRRFLRINSARKTAIRFGAVNLVGQRRAQRIGHCIHPLAVDLPQIDDVFPKQPELQRGRQVLRPRSPGTRKQRRRVNITAVCILSRQEPGQPSRNGPDPCAAPYCSGAADGSLNTRSAADARACRRMQTCRWASPSRVNHSIGNVNQHRMQNIRHNAIAGGAFLPEHPHCQSTSRVEGRSIGHPNISPAHPELVEGSS